MSTRLRATLARAVVCGRACTHTSPDFSQRHAHRCSPIGHRYTNQRTHSNPTLFSSYSLALHPFRLSLSLSPSVYLHSYGRAYRACIEASYVRTYKKRERGKKSERERRLTLESTIGERVCARVVDDAPRTRVKSRGEGIPAPPSSPSRRPPRLSPSLLPSILVLLSSRCTRSPPNLPPRRHLARARRAYTPPAARGAVSRVVAGGARRRRG